ncbi:acyl carrier protein [Streptomyces sp. NBC_01352]|uniref:Acyl carrier protein n=1 Tax=Streptomyces plumbiresistens TaxID=511811 RepID=A0ABP7QK39_9ACTN|nr:MULTISPECIES: acyl carrier protein [unclassified Streptomyces]MCX4705771.1 acyl carrier protein [Streptomyces sp. NBC_01373]MDQ1050673.1 act minimal PKS acyl carrier protein [Streptomyces sp. V4I2]
MTITLNDLVRVLTECAGADEDVALTAQKLDVPFTDLGYDSLALLETAALMKQRFGATLTDEDVTEIETPREFLDRVNHAAAQAA